MPLEYTMICMDNSEWCRNGDFQPSRWDSQQDAATMISESKTQQNPESTVGVLSMAGSRVEIKLTQSQEIGDLINCINNIQIKGYSNVLNAIKIAQLALKHRMNKAQRQRIVLFVGHPLNGTEAEYEEVGKRLKKGSVAIDVINFANPDNVSRLQTLVTAANNAGADENCHFLDIPLGVTHISDIIISSPIIQSIDVMGDAGVSAAVQDQNDPFAAQLAALGIDPNRDPELAQAIRMSMQDQQQQQNVEVQAAGSSAQVANNATEQRQAGVQPGLQPADDDDGMYDEADDEEKALQEALALSRAKPETQQIVEEKPQPTTADVDIDENFMKDVIGDLGIDVDPAQLEDIVNQATKPKKEEEKKDDQKNNEKK